MLLAICILSAAVIILIALFVRGERRSRRAEELSRRAEERSRRAEDKLDQYMAALDMITTPPQPPDDGGRHLKPLLAPVVWIGNKVRDHPGKAAAAVTAVASAAVLAAVWPSGHQPLPPIAMPAPPRPPASSTPRPQSPTPPVTVPAPPAAPSTEPARGPQHVALAGFTAAQTTPRAAGRPAAPPAAPPARPATNPAPVPPPAPTGAASAPPGVPNVPPVTVSKSSPPPPSCPLPLDLRPLLSVCIGG